LLVRCRWCPGQDDAGPSREAAASFILIAIVLFYALDQGDPRKILYDG
jgi:hypothetical protein